MCSHHEMTGSCLALWDNNTVNRPSRLVKHKPQHMERKTQYHKANLVQPQSLFSSAELLTLKLICSQTFLVAAYVLVLCVYLCWRLLQLAVHCLLLSKTSSSSRVFLCLSLSTAVHLQIEMLQGVGCPYVWLCVFIYFVGAFYCIWQRRSGGVMDREELCGGGQFWS